ncbi:hypothetical protein GCM10022226_19860 [Sphaerisporangium flaviroseum]|uniref:Uncharacterized protein n=1 Tax=Sphaerisporangium flaviroseum TaxID=509199 RepID=A0ABP7HNH4_9ACTN
MFPFGVTAPMPAETMRDTTAVKAGSSTRPSPSNGVTGTDTTDASACLTSSSIEIYSLVSGY